MTRLTKLSRSIEGRVAVVTGAASGMGRATAHLLADEGARVAVVDRSASGVRAVLAEIHGAHGPDAAAGFTVDLAERAAIEALIPAVHAALGRIDLLVNNAGISQGAPLAGDPEAHEEAWAMTIAINLTAHVRLIRTALDDLRRDKAGRVVNIASTEALGATAYLSPYTVAKHGVVGLTRSLAVELGPLGVNVNCVCPGPIRTGMTALIPDEAKEKFARRRVPLRRYGDPEEVAHATLALLLPAASFTNGAVVVVDGGMTSQNT